MGMAIMIDREKTIHLAREVSKTIIKHGKDMTEAEIVMALYMAAQARFYTWLKMKH